MTAKEYVQEVCPGNIDDECMGGVVGCPEDYGFVLKDLVPCRSKGSCEICWNSEILEEAKE